MGGWVVEKIEEEKAVRKSYCGLGLGWWVGGRREEIARRLTYIEKGTPAARSGWVGGWVGGRVGG